MYLFQMFQFYFYLRNQKLSVKFQFQIIILKQKNKDFDLGETKMYTVTMFIACKPLKDEPHEVAF